jgi:hypothetical protein
MTFLQIRSVMQRVSQNGPIRRGMLRLWSAGIVVATLLAQYMSLPVTASQLRSVAVVDFSITGPAPSISGLIPGRYAADDLSQTLAGVTHRPLTVIPREKVRDAEASLSWQSADLLRFDRLAELAQRVGADHLFVGRIESLITQTQRMSGLGGNMSRVDASVRVQVFDAAQKRFVGNALGGGLGMGPSQRVAAQQALHQANADALPKAVAKLPAAP